MSIQRRTWSLAAALGAALAGVGCEPPPTVSSVPPGVDLRETLMPKEEPAVANGETARPSKPDLLPGLVPAEPTAKGEVRTTPSGVSYETVKEGAGATALAGHTAKVHYVGTLDDGRVFDSSRKNGKPFAFRLGTGAVIKGWDEALPGMKVGEVRKITVPPAAGYGAQGGGASVPPNATLHFEVELLMAD